MFDPVSVTLLLIIFGLVAGTGITAVGPGGVLATAGLFLFTSLSPAAVAGTAIVTHVATGSLAASAYFHSGQLREPYTRRTALFGLLLGLFLLVIAVLVWLRHRGARLEDPFHPRHATVLLLTMGVVIAIASGLFGVGGPLLTVPLLVIIGTPMLAALAAAQVQSIVISSVGAIGYLSQGSIDWTLAAVVGIPELCGVVIGWKIARRVPARQLRTAMIITLLAVIPFLVLRR
jgi:uncharacterized membrane protein YfcA